MIKFKIGDVVEVIRFYPHYGEYGQVIGFHNDNVLVHFHDNLHRTAETKEYPKNSLKLIPLNWVRRDLFPKPTNVGESRIKRVIFSGNKTIILWDDNSKTMVSCAEGEQFDPYMGFCAAFTKSIFGSKHQVEKVVKNADYQPSIKKISETLKKLREADNDKEKLSEFLKKNLIIADKNSDLLIGKKVRYINPYSVFENRIGTITRIDEFGNYIVTIEIDDSIDLITQLAKSAGAKTVELPFNSYFFTFIETE